MYKTHLYYMKMFFLKLVYDVFFSFCQSFLVYVHCNVPCMCWVLITGYIPAWNWKRCENAKERLYLPICSESDAERPTWPLGHGLVRRALRFLICCLRTMCFLFSSASLSSSPLTILFFFLLVVCPSSPSLLHSPAVRVCFFSPHSSLFSPPSSPLLPHVPVLLWESGRTTFYHTGKTH